MALHKNARTTPAVRAEIAASNETASVLAQRFGITEQTVYKWKKRSVFWDRSHTAHHLQTVLTPAQEIVVVHLWRTLLLPLDDLLAVTREFVCLHVSRSGLDRCLRRHGAGNLNALKPQEPAVAFKSYEPGYVHMDVKCLPQMQDESSRCYLFVAIDRATRCVFVQFKANKTAASAQAFLKALHRACPIRISKLLTDNGKEFTDRLFASREREPSGNHEFDELCEELSMEHCGIPNAHKVVCKQMRVSLVPLLHKKNAPITRDAVRMGKSNDLACWRCPASWRARVLARAAGGQSAGMRSFWPG